MPPDTRREAPGAFIEQAFRSKQPELRTGAPAPARPAVALDALGLVVESELFSSDVHAATSGTGRQVTVVQGALTPTGPRVLTP